MNSYILSILITSPRTFKTLKTSVENIIKNVKKVNNIEIIIKIAQNEIEDYLPKISELLDLTPHIKILISESALEDTSQMESIKNLTLIADGEFLLLLDNEILVNLPDIDLVVKKYEGKLCVIEGPNNLSLHSPPIVHHEIVKILGLESLFNLMCGELGIEVKEPNISYILEDSQNSSQKFNWDGENKLPHLKAFINTLMSSHDWLPTINEENH